MNCDVKKLYRSKTDKIIFGVCGGIAEYLDVDPFIVRFMFIVSVLCFGYGILTYLVAAFIIKYK
ncbi:MAG: PspC domain-containing protein [Clostridiales bacterium]|nr:PspC domain-containing protein [Clostridiales bacterium]